ncbi:MULTISPECIES: hypothetical protein [Pseudomonas]|nr:MULTISPECIES: hypothetical protein [Pseudomonas]KAA8551448.1 hypothetical protein FX984_03943 [Pseudomonas marginalis]
MAFEFAAMVQENLAGTRKDKGIVTFNYPQVGRRRTQGFQLGQLI